MRPVTLPLLFLLAACNEDKPQPLPAPPAKSCAAADLQNLVGQPETALGTLQIDGPLRIIRPGMAVTMDYSEARLNVKVDATGHITGLNCG